MQTQKDNVIKAAIRLLEYVREKHGVKGNDFECPHFKSLACEVAKLEAEKE